MGRNRGFTAALVQIQRESERQARAQAAAATRAAREAERAHRAYERALAAEAKEQQRLYVESRMADVELRNEELQHDIAALQRLLADTLTVQSRTATEPRHLPPTRAHRTVGTTPRRP